jgi:hypothetical protein
MGSVVQFAAQLCNGNPEFKRNADDKERIAKEPSIKTRAGLVASPDQVTDLRENTTDRSVGVLSGARFVQILSSQTRLTILNLFLQEETGPGRKLQTMNWMRQACHAEVSI